MDRSSLLAEARVPGKKQLNERLSSDHPRLRRWLAGEALQQADYPSRRLRFGVFDADLRSGQLSKHGKRLRLQEQPFRLLTILLEQPGELVTRQELRGRLWPETTVL
jgi:DNA-binding response OmpR family regulator